MRFDNKIALVTGAGSGIGRQAAFLLAEQGAHVGVLTDKTAQALAVVDAIKKAGGTATPLTANVGDEMQMRQAIDHLTDLTGGLNLIVANAGINGVWAPIDELSPSDWDRTIAINLRGTYLALHLGVPWLKRAGAGAIVITSSINGTRVFSTAGATAYAASKAAQAAMAQMLALELAKHQIRVNTVCPGQIATGIEDSTKRLHPEEAGEPVHHPEGRVPLTDGEPGDARQVAELIAFLLSDEAKHISGSPVWIDGAESLLVG